MVTNSTKKPALPLDHCPINTSSRKHSKYVNDRKPVCNYKNPHLPRVSSSDLKKQRSKSSSDRYNRGSDVSNDSDSQTVFSEDMSSNNTLDKKSRSQRKKKFRNRNKSNKHIDCDFSDGSQSFDTVVLRKSDYSRHKESNLTPTSQRPSAGLIPIPQDSTFYQKYSHSPVSRSSSTTPTNKFPSFPPQQNTSFRSPYYAGPVFSNSSPDACSLPAPAFTPNFDEKPVNSAKNLQSMFNSMSISSNSPSPVNSSISLDSAIIAVNNLVASLNTGRPQNRLQSVYA